MAKQDRYNFDTAADDLGGDEDDVDEELTTDDTRVGENMQPRERDETAAVDDSETDDGASDPDEVPHRVRYDSPKDDRDQTMFYLEDDDLDRLSELERLATSTFDESVHATDVRLAAFRSDLSEENFLKEMRTIGYGFFD